MKKRIARRIKLRTWVSLGLIIILAPIVIAGFLRVMFAIGAPPVASANWRLDEGTGSTASDATNNSNNGTVSGAQWRTSDYCVNSNCLVFDGDSDTVSIADDADFDYAAADSFTFSLWVRYGSSGNSRIILDKNGAAGGIYRISIEPDGDITCGIDDDTTYGPEDSVTSTAATYDDNQWHHVACVKNATTSLTLYIDGVSVGTPDISFTATGTLANNGGFTLGGNILALGGGADFLGFMDEFRMYRVALTADEIKAEYNLKSQTRVSPFQSDALSDGLVGYWNLNETSGNATDTSGTGTTLTNNSTTPYTGAKFGNGGEFDGSTDYFEAADNATLSLTGDLTLSAWIQPDDTSGSQNIVGKWDGTNNSYLLAMEGDELRMYIDSASSYQTTTASNLVANTFTHVAGTYSADTQTVKLYVNGVEQTSTTTGTIPNSIGDDAGEVVVGADDSATNYFDGHIDDVRIYSRAKTGEQIRKIAQWAAGPVAHWKMDELTGQVVYDSSGNGFNGVLGEDVTVESNDPAWETGKTGGNLKFNGNGTYVSTVDNDLLDMYSTGSITIAAWVKRTGDANFSNPMMIIDKQNSGTSAGYWFALAGTTGECTPSTTTGTLPCFVMVDGTDTYTITALTPITATSTWHHIAVTVDRQNAANSRMYIDGVSVQTSTDGTFSSIGDISNSVSICIGSAAANDCTVGTANSFNGNIDDVRIYNYARTAGEILEDMNSSHPLGGSGTLTGYWKFDDQMGTTAQDSGKNNLDLTLGGSPSWTSSGKINGAIDLESGSSQYGTITDNFALSLTDYVTVEARIRPESVTAATVFPIAGKGDDYLLAQYGDEIRMYIGSSNYETTNAANLETSTWYHIVGVYNRITQTVRIYVNGQLQTSTTTGTIPTAIPDSAAAFNVGRYLDGTDSTYQISATADDGIEVANTTWVDNNAYVAFGRYDAGGGELDAGLRFNNVAIAQGSTISSAFLQVYGNTANSLGSATLGRIYADDVDDAAAWGSSSRPSQITTTTASIDWDPTVWGDTWMTSPDIASVIQEIVSRGGWASGNDLRLAIWSDGSANNNVISFVDYTTSSTNSPILYVTVGSTAYYYDGIIDEVKVYAGALTPDEVLVANNAGSSINLGVGQTAGAELTDGAGNPPVGWWKLDENTGTSAFDSTGGGSTGTLNHATLTWATGKISSGVNFTNTGGNGNARYITMGDVLDVGSNNFSISAWVKRTGNLPYTGSGEMYTFLDKWSTNGQESWSFLQYGSGEFALSLRDGGADGHDVYTSNPFTNNQWYHIAATVDRAGTARLFVNGVPQLTSAFGTMASITGSLSNTTALTIGRISDFSSGVGTPGTYMPFIIDEVKLYNYVRTPAQVAYEYSRGGPLAWYKMENCTGTTVNDLSASASDGVANNGTWSGASGGNTSAGTCTAVDAATAWYNGRNGKYNSSLDFDGTDDIVTVTNSARVDLNEGLSTGFTYAAWIYPHSDGETDVGQIFNKGTNTYCRTDSESSGRVDIECRVDLTTDAAFNVASAIPINQWSHVAFSWTNDADDEVTIWINGVANTSTATFAGDTAADANNLIIGGTPNFDGQIDDFRIYSYELSAAQIKTAMNEASVARFGPTTGTP